MSASNQASEQQAWVRRVIRDLTSKAIKADGSLNLPVTGNTGVGYTPAPHGSTHADGGTDPLPADAISSAMLQDGSVSNAKIVVGTITLDRISSSGASTGQVIGWNGSAITWLTVSGTDIDGDPTDGPFVPITGNVLVTGRINIGDTAHPINDTVTLLLRGAGTAPKNIDAANANTDASAVSIQGIGRTAIVGIGMGPTGGVDGTEGTGVEGRGQFGGVFYGNGSTGAAVTAIAYSGALAGDFAGDVEISGAVTISGILTAPISGLTGTISDAQHGSRGGGTLHAAATTATAGFATLAADGGTSAGTVVQGNDGRLSNSRTPTGAAGGVLAGTYPNPTFAVDMATQAELDAAVTAALVTVSGLYLPLTGGAIVNDLSVGNDLTVGRQLIVRDSIVLDNGDGLYSGIYQVGSSYASWTFRDDIGKITADVQVVLNDALSVGTDLEVLGYVTAGNLLVSGVVSAGNISTTPGAFVIPQADFSGRLPIGWIPTSTSSTSAAVPLANDPRLSDARTPVAHSASLITSGQVAPAQGGTGTANSGNLAWPSGGGTAALLATANTFSAAQVVALADSATTAASTVVTLRHNTSATPAATYGARLAFELQSSTTTNQSAGAVDVLWSDAAHLTRTSAFAWSTVSSAGALTERMRLSGAGQLMIRSTDTTRAAGLYAPWVSGDTLPAAYFGSSSSSNNQHGLISNAYSGRGVWGQADTGTGVYGASNSGVAGFFASTSATAVTATSTNSIFLGIVSPASTTATSTAMILRTTPTGSAGAGGVGLGIDFRLQANNSAAVVKDQVALVSTWISPTSTTETSRATLSTYYAGTAREGLRIDATSTGVAIGFLGATAVARPTAYTQTYATTTRTHAAPTATTVATTAATNTTPYGYSTAAQADALITTLNALITDVANVKQLLNSTIDDLQAYGLLA